MLLLDSSLNQLEKQMKFMGGWWMRNNTTHTLDLILQKDVAKGKISDEDRVEAKQRIRTTQSLRDFHDCDIVIEAVSENPTLKRELFSNLDKVE